MKNRLFSFLIITGLILSFLAIPSSIVLAVTAPSITNLGATNITETTARLNFSVNATGGESPHVWVVWKDTGHYLATAPERDGDIYEWRDYWQNVVDMGTLGVGSYYTDVSNLQCGDDTATGQPVGQVVYRVIAINSGGLAVSDAAAFWATQPAPKQSFTPVGNDYVKLRGPSIYGAQTFTTASAYDLYAVALYVVTSYSQNLTVTIKAVDGDSKPTGDALASDEIVPLNGAWNTFSFDSPASLSATTQYAIIVQTDYTDTDWVTLKLRKTSELYADGVLWRTTNDGGTWTLYSVYLGADCDMLFRTYDNDLFRRSLIQTRSPLVTDLTETTADLRGAIYKVWDYSANITFQYGATTGYGNETGITQVTSADIDVGTPITTSVSGLSAETEYHYRIKAVNSKGTSYGADSMFYTPDYSEDGETIVEDVGEFAGQIANQRKSFYTEGRYWVFYVAPSGYLSYKSSANGVTWSAPLVAVSEHIVEDNNDSQFCVYFDGLNVHLTTGRRDHKLGYKMGVPTPSGAISWNIAGYQEEIGTAEAGKLYTAPYITSDSSGYPWVLVGTCDVSSLTVQIFRSSANNGTWTTASTYPKNLSWGDFWQRGIVLPLPNGNLYFIAGRRGSALFSYNGAEQLKGVKYTASNDTFSNPTTITTTSMDYIGDVNLDPYALFSATSWGDEVYLAFTNTNNELKFLSYDSDTGAWTSETTLATGLARRTAPGLTVHDGDGKLFCFWLGDDNYIYYKSRNTENVWDTNPTVVAFENVLNNVANINTWEHSIEGKAFLLYRTSTTCAVGYRRSEVSGYPYFDLKGIGVATGFAVSTSAVSDIGAFTATLNGYVVEDDGEACYVRFQYGTTISYGASTEWQPGYTTGLYFDEDIYNLQSNTLYHVRAQAKHADSSTVNGADRTFTTSLYDDVMTGFKGIPAPTSIALSWNTGAPEYLIRFGLSSYPTNTTAGSLAYSGNSTSTTHTGLTAGTTYYYSLWGKNGESYTTEYATLMLTTSAYIAPGDTLPAPAEPTNWMAAPDYERMEGLGYFYDGVNGTADALEIPRATLWFLGYFGLCGVLAILFYLKIRQSRGAGTLAFGLLAILLWFGWIIHLVPFWAPLLSTLAVVLLSLAHKEVVQS